MGSASHFAFLLLNFTLKCIKISKLTNSIIYLFVISYKNN